MGIAATGSGKTLAFGLPGLQHILAQQKAAANGKQGMQKGCALPDLSAQNALHSFAGLLRTSRLYSHVKEPPACSAKQGLESAALQHASGPAACTCYIVVLALTGIAFGSCHSGYQSMQTVLAHAMTSKVAHLGC